MEPSISKKYFLSAGDANAEGELSIAVLVTNIIDIATSHANSLGIGNPSMVDINAGWVLSRLTIAMNNYPKVNQEYVISTWIEDFNRHFSTRCFKIDSPDGTNYGYARSIWLVMDAVNHTNLGLSHFSLPGSVILGEGVPIPRQEKHIQILAPDNTANATGKFLIATHPEFSYTFKYCDLDFYRHVNTVRYVVLLLNQFSLQEHDETMVARLELSFLHEANYGMETVLYRSDSSDAELSSAFQLSEKSDMSPVLFARIIRRNR